MSRTTYAIFFSLVLCIDGLLKYSVEIQIKSLFGALLPIHQISSRKSDQEIVLTVPHSFFRLLSYLKLEHGDSLEKYGILFPEHAWWSSWSEINMVTKHKKIEKILCYVVSMRSTNLHIKLHCLISFAHRLLH